jgi:magnesium-transporting ATPase (P-type)
MLPQAFCKPEPCGHIFRQMRIPCTSEVTDMTTDNLPLPPGLSAAEVRQSRETFGSGVLTVQKGTGFFRKLLESFSDPILKLMLAALAVNVLLLCRGEGWFETVGIALAVFLASFISTLSEYSSERAFRRLQEDAARSTCRARREGRTVTLPIEELVRGDLVLLEGDHVIMYTQERISHANLIQI